MDDNIQFKLKGGICERHGDFTVRYTSLNCPVCEMLKEKLIKEEFRLKMARVQIQMEELESAVSDILNT